jgi:hypothetical protein
VKDKDQVGNQRSGVPTVDIGLVDFCLPEKKLVLYNLAHFIRIELWDAPSGIKIFLNKIKVVYFEERTYVTVCIREVMKNIVIPSLGDVYHSPKQLAILANVDGNKFANTDEEGNIMTEDAQLV